MKISLSLYIPTSIAMNPSPPPDGVEIKHREQIIEFDSEGFSVLNLVIEISSSVSASVLAAWLYDKFVKKEKETQRERSIKINETELTCVTKDGILREVKRQIEYKDKP